MLDIIEKLLIIQDRDKRIIRLRQELAFIPVERQSLQGKSSSSQKSLDEAKLRVKTLESHRKEMELEVTQKKQQIEKYSLQQFQTKKNEEYRALEHEIETAKLAIHEIEDRELEVMEQIEGAQKISGESAQAAAEARKVVDEQVSVLAEREKNLQNELTQVEANRAQLATSVDESTLARYERILKSKGDNALVGIEHGVCGGCHMRLSRQLVVSCQAQKEVVLCPNCGRIIYFSRAMDVTIVD